MRHPNQVAVNVSPGRRSSEFNAYLMRQPPERRRELMRAEDMYVRERAQDNDPGPGILEETMRGYEDAPAGPRQWHKMGNEGDLY
jgi:hypothetical protein